MKTDQITEAIELFNELLNSWQALRSDVRRRISDGESPGDLANQLVPELDKALDKIEDLQRPQD